MNQQKLVESLKEKFPEFNQFDIFEMLDRKEFLPGANAIESYQDKAVPIGNFQHSLEPSAVIEILSILSLEQGDKVLELGTGCGFLTACIFKKITPGEIFTIERIKTLCSLAKGNLRKKFPNAIEDKKIRFIWENGLQSPNKFLSNTFDKICISFEVEKSFDLEGFTNILKPEGIIVFYQDKQLHAYTKSARNKPFHIMSKEVPYKFDMVKKGKN